LAKAEAKKLANKNGQDVEDFLASTKDEDFPTSMEEREQFCMAQLSAGEALFMQGKVTSGGLYRNSFFF